MKYENVFKGVKITVSDILYYMNPTDTISIVSVKPIRESQGNYNHFEGMIRDIPSHLLSKYIESIDVARHTLILEVAYYTHKDKK